MITEVFKWCVNQLIREARILRIHLISVEYWLAKYIKHKVLSSFKLSDY